MRASVIILALLATPALAQTTNGESLCKAITRDVFAGYMPAEMRDLMLGPAAPGDFICLGRGGQCPARLEVEVGGDASTLQPTAKSALCNTDKDRRVCPLEAGHVVRLTTEKGAFSYTVAPGGQLKIATKSNGFYSCTPSQHQE
jgi:hypothetical protein